MHSRPFPSGGRGGCAQAIEKETLRDLSQSRSKLKNILFVSILKRVDSLPCLYIWSKLSLEESGGCLSELQILFSLCEIRN